MKFSRYFSIVCILAIACILTVGCEKMQKPVMDAMDMAMTDTETPAEMDDTLQPVDQPEDDTDGETPAEIDDTETPAEMESDATLSISPTEIVLPEVGEQFTINVNIDSKEPVTSYQAKLTFDATVLNVVEQSITNYLSENDSDIGELTVDDGSILMAASSTTSTGIGEGTLATITFEVLEKKASKIILSDAFVVYSDLTLLDLAINEYTVAIQ